MDEHIGLPEISTAELVEELKRREGVEFVVVGPHAKGSVSAQGPAVLLSVTD